MIKIYDDDENNLYVNPGYMVTPFQISLKSVHALEREEVINILTYFRIYT